MNDKYTTLHLPYNTQWHVFVSHLMRPTTSRSEREVEAFEVTTLLNVGVLEDYTSYGDKIRVVELPYSDDQFSMFIFKSGTSSTHRGPVPFISQPAIRVKSPIPDRQHCFSDFQLHQTVNSIRGLTRGARHCLPLNPTYHLFSRALCDNCSLKLTF